MRPTAVLGIGAALLAVVAFALSLPSRADEKPGKQDPKDAPSATLQQNPAPAETAIYQIEGKTLEKWMDDTRSEDPSVRERAIRAIVRFGPRATIAVPYLVNRCQD